MSTEAPVAPLRQCGRCRLHFPVAVGTDPATLSDWWACRACHEKLFPGRTWHDTDDQPNSETEHTGTADAG
jgi:hypothetical protein